MPMPLLENAFTLVVLAQILMAGILKVLLFFRLKPVLNRQLSDHLDSFLDSDPWFFKRFARTGIYAAHVARKEWFSQGRREILAIDFRSGLSSTTIFLCWVFTANFILLLVEALLVAISHWVGWL